MVEIGLETGLEHWFGKWTLETSRAERWSGGLSAPWRPSGLNRVARGTPGEQPATPASAREVVCLLDCFLTFCLKTKFCQNNNKFEKHESSRWEELNAKIYGSNIRISLYIKVWESNKPGA